MSTAQGRVVQVAVHRLGRTPNEARCLFVAGVAVANSEYGEEPPAVPENLSFFFIINMGINNMAVIVIVLLSWDYHCLTMSDIMATSSSITSQLCAVRRCTKAGFVLQAIAHSHGPARYHLIRKLCVKMPGRLRCQRAANLPVWYLHLPRAMPFFEFKNGYPADKLEKSTRQAIMPLE